MIQQFRRENTLRRVFLHGLVLTCAFACYTPVDKDEMPTTTDMAAGSAGPSSFEQNAESSAGTGAGETIAGEVGQSGAGGSVSATTTGVDAKSQCDGVPGPSYADFFDDSKVATIRLSMDSAALGGQSVDTWLDHLWNTWTHCAPFIYTPVQLAYESPDGRGNVACQNVGMRLRGSMKRGTNQTQGFKLDMRVFDNSQVVRRRFADLNRINILSIESDPSHMMQCLSYKYLRDFGLPAPLCNHVKIYVNDAYYGLLENVEQVNKGFLRRHFGTNQGSLYGGSPSQADCPSPRDFRDSLARLTYDGDSFSAYVAQYQLTSATEAEAEQNLIPMLKCADETQTPDPTAFKQCIAEWIDIEEWLKQIAAESLMPSLQAWVGYYRNYYLYFKPDAAAPHGGRFVVWSWDLDTSFQRDTCYPRDCNPLTSVDGLYGPRNARAKFITRLTTAFSAEYCAAMKDFLTSVFDPASVDEMATVIEPAMVDEPSVSTADWQAEVTKIREFVVEKAANARTQVAEVCP